MGEYVGEKNREITGKYECEKTGKYPREKTGNTREKKQENTREKKQEIRTAVRIYEVRLGMIKCVKPVSKTFRPK